MYWVSWIIGGDPVSRIGNPVTCFHMGPGFPKWGPVFFLNRGPGFYVYFYFAIKKGSVFSVESILLRKTFCGKLGPPFGKLDPLFDYRVLYLGSKLPIFISKIAVLGSHFHESSSPFGKRGLTVWGQSWKFGQRMSLINALELISAVIKMSKI